MLFSPVIVDRYVLKGFLFFFQLFHRKVSEVLLPGTDVPSRQ